MPIYFAWFTTALLSVGGDASDQNLPQSGRLLYCVISGFINSYSGTLHTHKAEGTCSWRRTEQRKNQRRGAATKVGIGTAASSRFRFKEVLLARLPAGHFTTTVVRIQGWMQH